MKNKKKIIIIVSCIIAAIALFIFIPKNEKDDYITSQIERKTIVQSVEASGTVNPVQTVSIGSQVSGIIKNIYVDYNSKVKKGQILAQIDTSLFQAQVDQAQASLSSKKGTYEKAVATLEYNKANYIRYANLYKKNYVSKDEMELAKATYLAQKATVNSTREDINQAQATLRNNMTNLRYTKIISPVDGVVILKEVEIGQTVAASFQTPTLFSVAQDLTKMQIEASVSEADIGKVKTGQDVEYTLDGYPDRTFSGKVKQVRLASTTTNNVVTYTVVISVNNNEGILIPGMTANVQIITNKSENILAVPNLALKFTPAKSSKKYEQQGIWILEKGKPKRIEIETGANDDSTTEIKGTDIQEGTIVIVRSKKSDKAKSNMGMRHPPM